MRAYIAARTCHEHCTTWASKPLSTSFFFTQIELDTYHKHALAFPTHKLQEIGKLPIAGCKRILHSCLVLFFFLSVHLVRQSSLTISIFFSKIFLTSSMRTLCFVYHWMNFALLESLIVTIFPLSSYKFRFLHNRRRTLICVRNAGKIEHVSLLLSIQKVYFT